MREEYKPLFTPWKIRDVEIKNRIVLTSMGGTSLFGWMEPAHFDKEAAKFLLTRAKNNVGLILPGIAPIKNPMMGGWLYSNKRMYKDLKVYMEEFHKTGAKLFVQLTAGFGRSMAINDLMEKCCTNKVVGALLKPIFNMNWINAAPSVTPNRWSEKVMTKEMSEKQILKIIDAFAKTAKLCQDAGVDGIEVHAVHEGYLLDQFTMKYSNLRKDKWGGSFENRYRFPVEIVKAIKKACGENFPVSLRYSVVSKTKGFGLGALPEETYTEVGRDMVESELAAKYLQDAGYDMLNCDNGTYDAWYWAHPPMYMPENCNLSDVEHIKEFVTVPVVCAGRMTPKTAAKAISEGKLDAMGVARQFLADPEWVTKLMNDQEEEIRPCICCHNACFNMSHYKGVPNAQPLGDALHMARCAINPETMQSKNYFIKKSKVSRKVAVIGGGIGGMEVARVASLRGHKVTIYEKSDRLGGVFIAASAPAFKEKDRELLDWYRLQMKKLNVEVKFNTEIKNTKELKGSEIIIATGAKPRRIFFPGIATAIEAIDYLNNRNKVSGKVCVIGGGLTGCEIAYDLATRGQEVFIVEMKNDLITAPGVCLANSSYLRDYFAYKKVPVYLESTVNKITKECVTIKHKDGTEEDIPADSVIISAGYIPNPLKADGPRTYVVGDAYEVGNLRNVIWRAWDIAMSL